jgi:hypothetical protein
MCCSGTAVDLPTINSTRKDHIRLTITTTTTIIIMNINIINNDIDLQALVSNPGDSSGGIANEKPRRDS